MSMNSWMPIARRVAEHKELPFMVDALNCAMGCIYGTGVEPEKTAGDDVLYELHKIRGEEQEGQGTVGEIGDAEAAAGTG